MAAILTPPPVVPNGIYRIRSYARSNPVAYLEWHSDDEIKPAPLDPGSDIQKWKITQEQDDTYKISNVASNLTMSVKEYTEDNQEKYRLFAAPTETYWTLEPRGDAFVIGVVENFRCVDLAVNDWVILWERNNLTNQRWVLEVVETDNNGSDDDGSNTNSQKTTDIPAGSYNISNRATGSEICISTNSTEVDAPVLMWSPVRGARDSQSTGWHVSSSGTADHGLFITNSYYVAAGPRYLKEGAFVNTKTHVCYVVPVEGTNFFHIATDKSCLWFLQDFNPKGLSSEGMQATVALRIKDDYRQMWQFNAAQ